MVGVRHWLIVCRCSTRIIQRQRFQATGVRVSDWETFRMGFRQRHDLPNFQKVSRMRRAERQEKDQKTDQQGAEIHLASIPRQGLRAKGFSG